MTIDTDKLRELAQNATKGEWHDEFIVDAVTARISDNSFAVVAEIKHCDADGSYIAAVNPQTILALLDELDRLREQARQHQAFQEWTNQTEELRLNDARREGWQMAQEQAARICNEKAYDRFHEHGVREWDTNCCYYPGSRAEEFDALDEEDESLADAIRALQPPAEWASSEQCGVTPNVKSLVSKLTDSQRLELFADYCIYCGCSDPRCQCWNDE